MRLIVFICAFLCWYIRDVHALLLALHAVHNRCMHAHPSTLSYTIYVHTRRWFDLCLLFFTQTIRFNYILILTLTLFQLLLIHAIHGVSGTCWALFPSLMEHFLALCVCNNPPPGVKRLFTFPSARQSMCVSPFERCEFAEGQQTATPRFQESTFMIFMDDHVMLFHQTSQFSPT